MATDNRAVLELVSLSFFICLSHNNSQNKIKNSISLLLHTLGLLVFNFNATSFKLPN